MTKSEITFYQVDETAGKSLAPLLLKILEEKKKTLIFCKNPTRIKELDDSLWSYGRNKFIPHITISDDIFATQKIPLSRHPVVISDKEENANQADYLVFFDEPAPDFLSEFMRSFYFFDPANLATAKSLAKKLQPKNSYKKENGKWVKMDL